jgi:hypothetical protein
MRLLDDKDLAAVQAASSQVIKDAIGQAAVVLVPAISDALKGAVSGVQVNITVEPIKISIDIGERQ